MTRAMCSRKPKVKNAKPSQNTITEDHKENSPCNLQCLRKSERHRKSSLNNKDFIYNIPKCEPKADSSVKRNVLTDKTNSSLTRETKSSKQSSESPQTILNKHNHLSETINTCQTNEIRAVKDKSKPHIPVYKTIDPSTDLSCGLPPEKKEALYDFDEVDENEDPVKKRRKKRRVNLKKRRIGPNALTINNIKYSSTESLVSLPEKSVRQKKIKTKMAGPCIKPYTSVNNLNSSQDTCYSVQSFMSHPASLLLCDKGELKNKHELSVLQETQSENCQSPVQETCNLNTFTNQSEIMVNCHHNSNSVQISTMLPNDSRVSQDNSAVSQQRCYPSKKSLSDSNTNRILQCGSINDTSHNHVSHCSANISTGSSHDFLSSTPCKRISLVVRQNSVFNDSYEGDTPVRLRPSTGFIIKDDSEKMVIDDNFFGFDEPEELEEPLVSPIKNINLQEPRIPQHRRHGLSLYDKIENPKPDIKEVIEKLKSSIPKAQTKESSQVFNADSSSSDRSNTSSPISKEVETTLNLMKPPRRSYERQRRIRYYSEHEEEESDEEEEKSDEETDNNQQKQKKHETQERGNVLKPTNKCYQKKNVTKVFKAPQIPKAKQRILKEEEELERLAAQMNAQFQAIEKCSLVVE